MDTLNKKGVRGTELGKGHFPSEELEFSWISMKKWQVAEMLRKEPYYRYTATIKQEVPNYSISLPQYYLVREHPVRYSLEMGLKF